MTLSMYQASIPVFTRGLRALSGFLVRGEAFAAEKGIDPATLIGTRLIEDMHPFARQVQLASDAAKGAAARLAGVEVPGFPDEEQSFAELQERIAKTIAFIESVPAAQIEGSEDRAVTLKAPGREFHFTGQEYLLNFATPNFYFHITTAYAILRQQGVELGKMVFLGGGA